MWILCDHLEDQLTDLFGDSPATANSLWHFAERRPIQLECRLVPPNNRFRRHEKESVLPLRPEAAREHPKQLIEWPATRDGKPVVVFTSPTR